ncbi:Methyltransferase domain-containing protein [Promicromonospora umidemergens]|uniref:Methyltransferase domain-containing protein n=1 Tax=Promicromonospora umidemergens TaxID=629679 RepID=A0ABP8WKS4_9MICO|nr:class I SAM-dependent methyltransferase [Promicromonospora umidemergens]MCP2285875.1 Methyltransferase domain-containing protein [Promicromonospora umidemergens]
MDTTVQILDQRTPEERDREFLPGMNRSWLLPIYDLYSLLAGVRALHDRVAALAAVAPGESVLDVGCGTANLSLAVLRAQPAAITTGLDPDGSALRTAARKASRRRVPLTLVQGFADRLPVGDESVDHVVSALALHHMPEEDRIRFGHEAFRVLRPGGQVTIVDFADSDGHGKRGHGAGGHAAGGHGAGGHGARGHGARGQRGHGLPGQGHAGHDRSAAVGDPHTAPNPDGSLVHLLADAGFTDAREVERVEHRFGPLTFVQATRG